MILKIYLKLNYPKSQSHPPSLCLRLSNIHGRSLSFFNMIYCLMKFGNCILCVLFIVKLIWFMIELPDTIEKVIY